MTTASQMSRLDSTSLWHSLKDKVGFITGLLGFFSLDRTGSVIYISALMMVQSLDPLPMHGRDWGINPDDLVETPEPEQEAKQEILENKDVGSSSIIKTALV